MENVTFPPADPSAPPPALTDHPPTDTGPSLDDEPHRDPTPTSERDSATLKVKAKARGIYPNGVQREKGDRFTLAKEEDFSERWMRRDDEDVE